ncbi:hypothetical protein HDV06_003524 [Boothiomyces sp. JEL0866]|nr:hypothetical protein HDV06_003524 [Boothiomyces sp. JEL0866]
MNKLALSALLSVALATVNYQGTPFTPDNSGGYYILDPVDNVSGCYWTGANPIQALNIQDTQCANACMNNPQCNAWSFTYGSPPSGTCYLFSNHIYELQINGGQRMFNCGFNINRNPGCKDDGTNINCGSNNPQPSPHLCLDLINQKRMQYRGISNPLQWDYSYQARAQVITNEGFWPKGHRDDTDVAQVWAPEDDCPGAVYAWLEGEMTYPGSGVCKPRDSNCPIVDIAEFYSMMT